MQNGSVAVENSLAVLKKLNTKLPYDPATPLLDIYLKELRTGALTKACTRMFAVALFTKAKKRKQAKRPSTNDR